MSTAAAARQPVLRIGLTGGIASGKSTVAQLFAAHGVPILDADRIAREVIAPGSALLAQLFERFGEQIRDSRGDLDRAGIAHDFLEVTPATRLCVTLVDEEAGTATELIEEGSNGVVAASAEPEVIAAAIVRVHEAGMELRERTAAWFAENAQRLSLESSLEKVLESYARPSARS